VAAIAFERDVVASQACGDDVFELVSGHGSDSLWGELPVGTGAPKAVGRRCAAQGRDVHQFLIL
jgi:hypothetical protein